jgi:hypothetical protein
MAEDSLELVSGIAAKPTRDSSHQVQIHRTLGTEIGTSRIDEILRATRKAFHRNEIFPADEANLITQKRHFYASRKGAWIETAKASEQIDLISVRVAQHEHHWNGIIGIPLTQCGLEAGGLEDMPQLLGPREGYLQQGIYIPRGTYDAVDREREGSDNEVVDLLTPQAFDGVQEKKRRLPWTTRSHRV